MPAQEFLDFLKTQAIPHHLHTHEPIFSATEADHIKTYIPGAHSKNLFLRDKKKNYYLVTVLDHKRVNLKELSKLLGQGHLSFGSAEDLYEKLKVRPGSVTPFSLIHDQQKEIGYVLDQDILQEEAVNFHPLRNDMTIHMALDVFLNLITQIHCKPQTMVLPSL